MIGETPRDDLIVARATAAGSGGVAIVRADGAGARKLTEKMFRPAGGRSPVEQARTMVFGRWIDAQGETIDTGLTVFFAGPASYTGNDLAEFHCHGGAVPSRRLLEEAERLGARPAEPGEFTRRAYLNGRMDLAQAEGVSDLINAQTEGAARAAQAQLAGGLSRRMGEVREGLIRLAAEIEAQIDFPDEDLGEGDRRRMEGMFDAAEGELKALLATRRRGALLREGARVALVGRPNAGKSSLLNALARRERAIVSPHPGTTRDTVECTVELAGMAVTLIDTAGLRASDDPVERIGIERTREEIAAADLVIEVRDMGEGEGEGKGGSVLEGRGADFLVLNKCDLYPEKSDDKEAIALSAVRGDGLEALEQAIAARLLGDAGAGGIQWAVSARHAGLIERAIASLQAAYDAFRAGSSGELVMVDLREGLDAAGEVLGVRTGDAVLDAVFKGFCIGK